MTVNGLIECNNGFGYFDACVISLQISVNNNTFSKFSSSLLELHYIRKVTTDEQLALRVVINRRIRWCGGRMCTFVISCGTQTLARKVQMVTMWHVVEDDGRAKHAYCKKYIEIGCMNVYDVRVRV